MIIKWVILPFLLLGSFLVALILGEITARFLGVWSKVVSGSFAAFVVVLVGYGFAPKYKLIISFLVFLIGSAFAIYFLKNAFFPESYIEKAYQHSWLPLTSTISSGLLSFICCLFINHLNKD